MIKRELAELATYTVDEECETLPLACLRKVYLEKTSEIIYINKGKKLYGIVCMGEVLYGNKQNTLVKINKHFRSLNGFNLIKACEFFERRTDINKIPVVNEEGELIGDYSRWDMLYVEQNQIRLMQKKTVKRVLGNYEKIYVIQPSEKTHPDYLRLLKYLTQFEIDYSVLKKEELYENMRGYNVICIFLDEDERRGMQCLCGIEPRAYDPGGYNRFRFDISVSEWCKARLTTYENLLRQIEEEEKLERLGLEGSVDLAYERLDYKATVLLSALQARGSKCFFLYLDERKKTEYGKWFSHEVAKRVKSIPLKQEERMWPEGAEREAFFGELYQLKDYRDGVAQTEIYDANFSFAYKRNITGKYFNAIEGKRATCFQPDQYIGTIYLMGLCGMIGMYVEDQHTIASYLQKKLLEKGYLYRVENYASNLRYDADIDIKLEEIGECSENDIVIYMSSIGEGVGMKGISFEKIFEKHHAPVQWVTDGYGHCNYQANQIVAENIFEMIETDLVKNNADGNILAEGKSIDICDIMSRYVQREYLNRYFLGFDGSKYETVGAIVMSANPFNKGHRYLIEEAKRQVEFLVIFLREEEMLFSFEERFKMLMEGIQDIENIMVVPSGKFILSRNKFQVYYSKKVTVLNAEYDINVFADYIAKPLNITHRFAGEKSKDNITRTYNNIMKEILPQKKISFVEIPKMQIDGVTVSTVEVHKYLKKENYDYAWRFLPQTTKNYLRHQLAI